MLDIFVFEMISCSPGWPLTPVWLRMTLIPDSPVEVIGVDHYIVPGSRGAENELGAC